MLRQIIIAFIFGMILIYLFPVHAQDMSGHPQRDQAIHELFYNTWMMPDRPSISCCHKADCAPAETYWENGHWMARKVDDKGEFIQIPDQKVEQGRDSPDGRSHLCGQRAFPSGDFTVYCFIPGSGS